MFKIITFDFWDTLVEEKSYREKRIDILYEFLSKKSEDVYYDNVFKSYKLLNEYLKRVREYENYRYVSIEERLSFIMSSLSFETNEQEINIIIDKFQKIVLEDMPLLKKGVNEVLLKLQSKFLLGIISDTGFTCANTVREILKCYGVYNIFNFLIFSEEVGWNKPSINVFNEIYVYENCKSNEILHIGDCYETDIVGSLSNGINVIHINNSSEDVISVDERKGYFKTNNIEKCLEIIKG